MGTEPNVLCSVLWSSRSSLPPRSPPSTTSPSPSTSSPASSPLPTLPPHSAPSGSITSPPTTRQCLRRAPRVPRHRVPLPQPSRPHFQPHLRPHPRRLHCRPIPLPLAQQPALQQLANVSGELLEFLATAFPSLDHLALAFNLLSGPVPAAYAAALFRSRWFNNQPSNNSPMSLASSRSSSPPRSPPSTISPSLSTSSPTPSPPPTLPPRSAPSGSTTSPPTTRQCLQRAPGVPRHRVPLPRPPHPCFQPSLQHRPRRLRCRPISLPLAQQPALQQLANVSGKLPKFLATTFPSLDHLALVFNLLSGPFPVAYATARSAPGLLSPPTTRRPSAPGQLAALPPIATCHRWRKRRKEEEAMGWGVRGRGIV